MGNPTRTCDLVLKGGITSGIVYPKAVCELAEEFRFVNIGGASAGAIAAALTAAAEYRRQNGSGEGFDDLRRLPAWLGERNGDRSNLLSLFQPSKRTEAIFRVGMRAIQTRSVLRTLLALAAEFVHITAPVFAAGVAVAVVLVVAAILLSAGHAFLAPLLLLLALGALGLTTAAAIAAAAIGALCQARREIPRNFFGICSGSPGLTNWLHERINALAGRAADDAPLTLRDLWTVNGGSESNRSIDVQMMTTNLTERRPYTLPFSTRVFYFARSEFEKLFPETVVKYLVEHARPARGRRATKPEDLHALPAAADMPLVVLARMSLSFPVLLSAVPLYAVDHGRRGHKTPEQCWFSDGGITSNFPVHFFDAPLPSRPTFAINLAGWTGRYHEPGQTIYVPRNNRAGIREWWDPFNDVVGFLKSIVFTMHGWRDNMLLRVPGYRDRVAHVILTEREGGLNLAMSAEEIDKIAGRGREAAAILRRRFGDPPPAGETITWTNHRWVRFLTYMTALEESLAAFTARLPRYRDLLDGSTPLPSYKVPRQVLERFKQTTFAFAKETSIAFDGLPFEASSKTPRPRPNLGLRPQI